MSSKVKDLYVRHSDGTLEKTKALEGLSAYDSAVLGGYTGTEAEFYQKLSDVTTKTYVDENIDELNQTIVDKVDTYKLINLCDLSNIVLDKCISSNSSGEPFQTKDVSGWCYVVLPIEPNTYYTINKMDLISKGSCGFYDNNMVCTETWNDLENTNRYTEVSYQTKCFKTSPTTNFIGLEFVKEKYAKDLIMVKGCQYWLSEYILGTKYPYGYIFNKSIKEHPDGVMNYIYVAVGGSDIDGDGSKENPYATIEFANDTIVDNCKLNPYTIIVGFGTYDDLEKKYSGIKSSNLYQGVNCKDYVYYESEDITKPDLCVLKWDGAVGFDNPTSDDVFGKSIFHVLTTYKEESMHTHIKGFTFECKNVRYASHVELHGYSNDADILFKNCNFNFHGRDDVSNPTESAGYYSVGCGGSSNATLKFINCNFVCDGTLATNRAWFIHSNNEHHLNKYGMEVIVDKCNFNNLPISANTGKIHSTDYITPCTVTVRNCSKPLRYEKNDSDGVTSIWTWIKEGTNAND